MNMYETVIGSHRVTKVPAGPGVLANCCRQLINQILLIPYQAVQLITGPVSEILCKSCLEIGCVGGSMLRGREGHNWAGTIVGSNGSKITSTAGDSDSLSAFGWDLESREGELSPSSSSLETGAG